MYLDHLQNWLVYGYSLLIFLILALFWLSETGQIWGFRALSGERIEGMAWNFARWCILSTFRTDQFMATVCGFFQFWHYFDLVKRVKFGVSRHILENAWGNGLKFCMLMYLDYLHKWLVLGHGLSTFVILALFWLSEMGQIWGFRAFPGECMEGMAWNMVRCCILTPSRTD